VASRSHLTGTLAFTVALLAFGCGSARGPRFEESSTPDGGSPRAATDACATSTAAAKIAALNLVIIYDKSGSMGNPAENASFDPAKRWIPVGAALKEFVTDPSTNAGISASLAFFPLDAQPDAGVGGISLACNGDYQTPRVPMTLLATGGGAVIAAAIDATNPSGGTPTLPALQGAIAYARELAAQRPGDSTAVVLQTDGYPGMMVDGQFGPGCVDNDIAHVAAAAEQAFKGTPSIPTYVIGVDAALADLNRIAAAGGTGAAFMVAVGDPTATKLAFASALAAIRVSAAFCELALPPPPQGRVLDTRAVSVVIENAAGQKSSLAYNGECSGGVGWRYDDVASPSRAILCPASCQAARTDATTRISIAIECAAR
jgi:hypothetical protein